MNVVGIFRRAPNNVTLRQIKDKFDRGEAVDLEEMGDCHLAAVLIKLLLRELPQPLLTFQAYSSIVEIRGGMVCIQLICTVKYWLFQRSLCLQLPIHV